MRLTPPRSFLRSRDACVIKSYSEQHTLPVLCIPAYSVPCTCDNPPTPRITTTLPPVQLNAATELGLLIITSFEENERAVDDTRLSQLKRVAEAMTPGVEMSEYLKRAIRLVVRLSKIR